MEKCYIDGKYCSGARFSFCDDCKKAKLENSEEIDNAKTPVEMTTAHVTKGTRPIPCGLDYYYKIIYRCPKCGCLLGYMGDKICCTNINCREKIDWRNMPRNCSDECRSAYVKLLNKYSVKEILDPNKNTKLNREKEALLNFWINQSLKKENEFSKTKVFLGGTCRGYKWRDDLIPLLKCDYYNPIVKNWSESDRLREVHERETADYVLYVITSGMKGVYSIAEVIDDSNKRPEKTILCVLYDGIEKQMAHSLTAVVNLAKSNGVTVCESLTDIADFLNKKGGNLNNG